MENIIFAVLVLGAIAIVFGLILSVAAKVFEVKVDERLPKIQECLAELRRLRLPRLRRLRGSDPRRQGSRHRLRARRRGGRCQDRRNHGHGSAQRCEDGRSCHLQRR